MLTLDFDFNDHPLKAFNSRHGATLCECCGEGLDLGDAILHTDDKYEEGYGYVHPACVGVTEICQCCGDWLVGATVKARYTLPGYVYDYAYCSESCKAEHHLQIIRNHGL